MAAKVLKKWAQLWADGRATASFDTLAELEKWKDRMQRQHRNGGINPEFVGKPYLSAKPKVPR